MLFNNDMIVASANKIVISNGDNIYEDDKFDDEDEMMAMVV